MTQALLKQVQDMTSQIEAQKQALVEKLKPEFKSLFVPFFEKYPAVKKIRFTQYTPYFNDGEECIFRVGDLYTFIEGLHNEEDKYSWQEGSFSERFFTPSETNDYWKEDREKYKGFFGDKWQEFGKDLNELCAAHGSLPDDTMKELFGDHVQVLITREGVDVEEYDHD